MSEESCPEIQARAQAVARHPVGARLAEQGVFDHVRVRAYFRALGEVPPVPAAVVGVLLRRRTFVYDEIGEVYENQPADGADRPRFLYRLARRGMTETLDENIEYFTPQSVVVPPEDVARLGPPPLGLDGHTVALPPALLTLLQPLLCSGFMRAPLINGGG